MKKRVLAVVMCALMAGTAFTGFKDAGDDKELVLFTWEGMFPQEVLDDFEKETGVKVELTIDKNIEDIIQPQMKSGEYPDVIMRAVGSESAITETFIKDNNVEELTDVLDMTVPGVDAKVGDKILPGFTENSIVNPYGDGKTYLMPMFYSPCGLFYDANLFKTKGWDVPET